MPLSIAITSQRKVATKAAISPPKIKLSPPAITQVTEKDDREILVFKPLEELTLTEKCKIAVWMDQFQAEEFVQMKFKNSFANPPPSKETISQIHQRFIETGSVLEQVQSPSSPSDDSKRLKLEKDDFSFFEYEGEEDLELEYILNKEHETGVSLESLIEKKNKTSLVKKAKEKETSVMMLCNDIGDNQQFSEISITEGEYNDKIMEVIYCCIHCGYKTSNKESYDLHVETHAMDFFQCSKCSFTSNNTTAFRSHVKLCERDKKVDWDASVDSKETMSHLCSECGKAYSSASALKTHMVFHSHLRPFACNQCKYRFKTNAELLRHTDSHDKMRNLECPYCNYTCSIRSMMVVHIRAHSGEKPFKCSQCDYCSASKLMLKRHLITHDKTSEYKCSECNYTTNRISFLKSHQLKHSEEKNFKCQLCPLSFKTPSALNYHMNKVHTKNKLYECPFCDFRQPILHALRVHIRTHTGEKPHACPHCDVRFIRSQELKKHIKQNHER